MGSVTFLVQREQVLQEIDARLLSQVESLQTVAGAGSSPSANPTPGTTTATDDLSIEDYDSVAEFLHAAVARLVPGRNEHPSPSSTENRATGRRRSPGSTSPTIRRSSIARSARRDGRVTP